MTIGDLLRNVRKRARLSQVAFSAKTGIAQSALSQIENGDRNPNWETVDKILSATGNTLVCIPSRREDASTIASRIASAESRDDKRAAARAFIQLNDNLVDEHDEVRFALTITEPPATGKKHWDAAIAALVTHHLTEEGLPVPRWARDPAKRLKKSWTFTAGSYRVPVDRDRVPAAFLDHNVLIDRETLVSY